MHRATSILYFPNKDTLNLIYINGNLGNQSWIFIGRTDAEAETPTLWPPDVKNWLIGKYPDAGKDWRQKEKGMTEDEIIGWHHHLDGHEFEEAMWFGNGQGSLACCSPCSHKKIRNGWMTQLMKNMWLATSVSCLIHLLKYWKLIHYLFSMHLFDSNFWSAFHIPNFCWKPCRNWYE